jgi:hypothetical protein
MLPHESADDIFGLADGADDFSLRDMVVSAHIVLVERDCTVPSRGTEVECE